MSKSNLALIRGAGGGGKSGGGSGRVAQEAPDSLRSRQNATVLDLVSEGEIGGLVNGFQSVFLDDTPLQNPDGTFNFDGVSVTTRNGTQSQEYIPDVAGVENETSVSVEVKNGTPITRTISDSNIDAARITLSVPSLKQQNTTNGDINGTSVRIAIDVQSNGGGYVPQVIGVDGYNLSVSGLMATSLGKDIVSAQVRVNWTGLAAYAPGNQWVLGDTQQGLFQSVSWRLDYRQVGDLEWIPLRSGKFSGSSFKAGNPLTGYYPAAPTGSEAISFTPDNVANYEFNLIKLSGDGSLSISGDATGPVKYDIISGKTSSKYQRAYKLKLTGDAPWDIRVRRLTADSTSDALQNETWFDSYTEIIEQKLTYPNSALVAVSIDAERFSSIPVRGYEIYGILIRIPSNYDPITREYDGVWDGTFKTEWSDNPAWVFYDILTNARYGAGKFISPDLIDKWSLYSIAQYCDELVPDGYGGVEPRFTCNIYLQTREEAYKVIQSLASVFNAVTYWSAGGIIPVQDSPKDPVALFTAANVIDGNFEYSGSSLRTRSTIAMVTWTDPDDKYRQAVEYVEDTEGVNRYGVRQKEVIAIGATSRGQAHRFGKAILFSERMETETVSFEVGLEGLMIAPGDIIQTSDPSRAGERLGGRILSATTSAITLDADVTLLTGVTYTLWCLLPDGSVENREVSNSAGTTNVLTVLSDFTEAPLSMATWVLGSSVSEPETWRVVGIQEKDEFTAQVTALEYRQDKYQAIESDLVLETRNVSGIDTTTQAPVSNVTIEEQLYLINASSVGVSLSVSWTGNANYYEVQWRRDNGNFQTITTSSTSIDIQPVTAGLFDVNITAINAVGVRSPVNSNQVEVYGLTAPPIDVTNFAMQAINGNAHFSFDASPDLDVVVGGHLRVRHSSLITGATWSSAVDIGPKQAGGSTNAVLPLLKGTYLAKWVDASGNESVNAVAISTTAPSVINMNFVATATEDSTFAGVKQNVGIGTFGGNDALVLDSSGLISDVDLISEIESFASIGGQAVSGIYYFDDNIDLGSVQTSLVTGDIESYSYRNDDLISKWGLISQLESISASENSRSSATLQIRITDDDPSGSPMWSDWRNFNAGNIEARAYEFRVILAAESSSQNVAVVKLSVSVDMPDKLQSGNDIDSGTSVYSISFDSDFYVNPAIAITAQGMQTGDYYEVTDKSISGFDITFKNSGGTVISRTFDYIARGY